MRLAFLCTIVLVEMGGPLTFGSQGVVVVVWLLYLVMAMKTLGYVWASVSGCCLVWAQAWIYP